MPPWSDIDTIMFDMDGTLLDLHFDTYFWQELVPSIYSQTHGISKDAAREIIMLKYAEVRGTLDWYCLDYWKQELRLDVANLKTTIKHKIKIRPNVLITNAHPASLRIKMEHTGIAEYFHQCISSHSLQLAKENHGFWDSLKRLEPYEPDRTALFDDSLPVLRQARREGIRHLYAIKQPDSQQPSLEAAEFPQIEDFDHIMPSRKGGARQE